MAWTWSDARPIGEALYDKFPDQHPLEVRFTDLHRWVCELDEFGDDPDRSSESNLEAIQMIWYEEYKLDHGE
jgi:FeS assembly protein IscX